MNRTHKRKGFTLIEILISITILLAISFIGVIKYVNVVEENNVKIDIINAKTIADGINIAILSDAIDAPQITGGSVSDSKLEPYLDTTIKPKSKKYGGKNGNFTYNVSDKGQVTVSANNTQVYPYTPEKVVTTSDK